MVNDKGGMLNNYYYKEEWGIVKRNKLWRNLFYRSYIGKYCDK